MSWISHRLAEPSTRLGLGVVLAALTTVAAHPPADTAGWLSLLLATLGGLAGVVTKAPGSPDA